MEKHSIKGNFVKKYFPGKEELEVNFPSNIAELSAVAKAGKIIIAGKEFKLDESQLCSWAYRGFSLQHQGAEPMSEAEKAKAKAARAEVSKTNKAAKEAGIDIKSLILAELARRKAAGLPENPPPK